MVNFTKTLIFTLLSFVAVGQLSAQTLQGKCTDKTTGEPLIGVTLIVKGTTKGVSTEVDGSYTLTDVAPGSVLQISYISYKSVETAALTIAKGATQTLNFALESDNLAIESVQIVARKNLESDAVLQVERIESSFALENIGAKEMSIKGISNASEGVKKMSSVTEADGGQVFVRGLGDRYSLTTLNGLPIASPNANNKLISLDLFPSSIISNITVSKVYNASSFADYSGARIDIGTKQSVGEDFFSISLSTGGSIGTMFNDFYSADNAGLFNNQKLPDVVKNIVGNATFDTYIEQNELFETSYDISKSQALPDFSGTASGGKTWRFEDNKSLSLIATANVSNSYSSTEDKYSASYNVQKVKQKETSSNEYSHKFKTTALASLVYGYGDASKLAYTGFYTRSLEDTYELSQVWTDNGNTGGLNNVSSNSSREIYTLVTNQLTGNHKFNDKFSMNYAASYSSTSGDQPDLRQILYIDNGDGTYSISAADQIDNNRLFYELQENEILANVNAQYHYGDKNKLTFGLGYKNKDRDYELVKFTYDLSAYANEKITDISNVGTTYINFDNISSGAIGITKWSPSFQSYLAGTTIYAPYIENDFNWGNLLINAGLRFEYSDQWVTYWTDSSGSTSLDRTIESLDLFPTINLKYQLKSSSALRAGVSRTVTRPSYYEMAPFLYEPNYGGDEIIGNENLINGYNYNFDLRYEYFRPKSQDMISLTGYYKILIDPIEQVQQLSGSTVQQTFRNADTGMAAGIELELRKGFLEYFSFGFNASYIYTNVVLNDGVYTDPERMLQGASPYIVNADITFNKKFENEGSLNLALMYNLQGERISSVGIMNMENTMEEDYHTLNFTAGYTFNKHWSVKLQLDNLLDSESRYTQEMSDGDVITVKSYKSGIGASLGVSYKF